MPGSELKSLASGVRGADDADGGEQIDKIYAVIARLIIGWRVWDATVPVKADSETGELIHDEETEPRLLPSPATAELVARLPQVILMDLMNEVTAVINPPKTPQAPEDGTSKAS